MQNDLISIIIPCKNGSNYLKEAIAGIKKQNMNLEIIVIDDGSTDNTAQIAETEGCKVIKHEKTLGFNAGKNSGITAATGKFIMFHDHDDIMRENTLSQLYQALQNDNSVSVVMAKVQDFLSPDCENKNVSIKAEPYYGLFTGAVLIRKEVFDTIGLFDGSKKAGEMLYFSHKIDEHNLKMKKIDFVATNRRVHDTNFGRTNAKDEHLAYAAVLRAKLMKK